MKILVVDDEKIILQGIVRLLKSNPLVDDVYWAEDAFIALDFLKGHQVDAVVTDIRMPDGTGLELLQECRGIQPDVKSVILSGYGEFEYAQKALRLGSFDFLTKPVDFSQLTAIFLKLHDTLSQLETQNRNLQEVYRLKKDNFFHNTFF